MAATAILNDLDEFLAEVDGDREEGQIARRIVRVTKVMYAAVEGAAVTRVRVEAAYRAGGEIVRFRNVVGDLWRHDKDKEVEDAAAALIARLEEALDARGLKVRAGFYEDGA